MAVGLQVDATTRETNNLVAIVYLMIGMALLSAMDAVAKTMVEAQYPVAQTLAVRSWIIVPILFLWALGQRNNLKNIKTKRWKVHIFRAVIGFCAPFFFFTALGEMPLADVTVLFFASPFIMTALSVPLFKEKVGFQRWISIVIGFVGVIIIVQPGSTTFQSAAIWALVGCFAYSIIGLMVRWMSDTESSFCIVFYFNLGILVIASAFMPFQWVPIPLEDLWMFVAMALLAMVGHIFLTKAFAIGEMATVTPFEYSTLIWAVLFGFVFWGDLPEMHVWWGAAIIVSCGMYILYREKKKAKTITPPVTDLP
ncbi:DMT family transporter [Curvivirga sp.]|uniref:DMT family transporter n=1 Tax=Curvivirga sp. TaxID=2856848 RepID=UPI003B5AE57B